MTKEYWKSYELKKFGMHHKSARALLRIQRKEIYANKKQEELKLRAMTLLQWMNAGMCLDESYADKD